MVVQEALEWICTYQNNNSKEEDGKMDLLVKYMIE